MNVNILISLLLISETFSSFSSLIATMKHIRLAKILNNFLKYLIWNKLRINCKKRRRSEPNVGSHCDIITLIELWNFCNENESDRRKNDNKVENLEISGIIFILNVIILIILHFNCTNDIFQWIFCYVIFFSLFFKLLVYLSRSLIFYIFYNF